MVVRTDTPLDLEICGDNGYNFNNKEEYYLKGVNNGWCVKNKTALFVRSSLRSSVFNMLDLRLNTCVNSTAPGSVVCASHEE